MQWEQIKVHIKPCVPASIWERGKLIRLFVRRLRYRTFGWPKRAGETSKARARRERENFFTKYCQGIGLDIGWGGDLIHPNAVGWDFENGDAEQLKSVKDAKFNFVYSSHTLEDMVDPVVALQNWWRVLKSGGYLIIYIPDRDLYEKNKTLPSKWNSAHRHFFLIDRDEPPDTIGIVALIERTLAPCEILESRVCSEGHTITDPNIHSDGEYSIEVVVRKRSA